VLAGDRGAQPGCDLEQVEHDRVVEVNRQLLGKLLDRRACRRGQVLLEVRHPLVETLDHRVELGAEAGGEDHDLEQIGTVTQDRECLREIVLEDRDALEHVKRCSLMLETDDND
jgi:hypothetical protein